MDLLAGFLAELEVTRMNRSYKMLVLLAMLAEDAFPGAIDLDRLTGRFAELARRYAVVRTELGRRLDDRNRLRRVIEENPVKAWVGGRGTGGVSYFSFSDDRFSTTFDVPDELREPLQDLVRELVEWRLAAHIERSRQEAGAERIVATVGHTHGKPALLLAAPEPRIGPHGVWHEVVIDGERLHARFEKDSVPEIVRPGSSDNLLPEILRRWYGSGSGGDWQREVVFERSGHAYTVAPAESDEGAGSKE